MVRPVVFAVDDAEGPRLQVDGIDHFRRAGGPLVFECAAATALGRGARDRLAFEIGCDANQKGFVAIDRVLAGANSGRSGQLGDFAYGLGIEVDGYDRVPAPDVGFAGAPRGGDHAAVGGDNFNFRWSDAKSGKIYSGDAFGRVQDEFIALGGVAVLVKIKASAAGVGGEPDDAMAGVGVDPIGPKRAWSGFSGEETTEEQGQGGKETKVKRHSEQGFVRKTRAGRRRCREATRTV